MKQNLLYLINMVFIFSCSTIEVELPENVVETLEKSGDNKPELEKVIKHYQKTGEVIKEEAAYFLIGNMGKHGYATYVLIDSNDMEIPFSIFDYSDYDELLTGWDSIEEARGEIHFKRDKLIKDYDTITADHLINNIDLAYKAWDENLWSKHLNFDQFCEYILPYRGSSDPLEDWRSYFAENLAWVKDSVKDPGDPIEAAIFINDYIKSWFRFDPRYYEHPTDQGLTEMLENKMGRCEDMTNLAIYAFRSMGVPVMSDYTPYWANTGNNHAWNATIDKDGKVIIFMGGEANPGKYKLRHKKAKVYRKTFSKQKGCLSEVKKEWEKAPPYLRHNTYVDVTEDYCPVKSIKLTLENTIPDSTNFAYICVFNTGKWRAIHWSKIRNNKVYFSNMGMGIAYLPAFYYDKEIIPAGNAIILSDSGKVIPMIPDLNNTISVNLYSTTKRKTKEATDFIEQAAFEKGKNYTLYYWDDKWIEIGKQKAKDGPLNFNNVPSNAIYWLVAEKSRKEERIFTIDENDKQVWW